MPPSVMPLSRRRLLTGAGALLAAGAWPAAARARPPMRVVIVGAGFAGTTCAKYLKRFDPAIDVTVVEPAKRLMCCPMSVRVICGSLALRDISVDYATFFSKYGIRWIAAGADAIDVAGRRVRAGRETLDYDALVVCTGVQFDYTGIAGLETPEAQARVLHAWRAGPQTLALRDRLKALRDGATFGLCIPRDPMRARTAAYERAAMVAHYFREHRIDAKVLVFDAHATMPFGDGNVLAAWKARYGDMIEYVPDCEIAEVDAATQSVRFKAQGRHRLDLLNLVPPQRATDLLARSGLTGGPDGRWCPVDFRTFAAQGAADVHVLGDAVAGVNGLPKSGQMANQEAKVCAAALAARSLDREVDATPTMISAGYMYVTPQEAFTATAVYRYDDARRQPVAVPASVVASAEPSLNSGLLGMSWSTNILNDMMG